MGRRWLSGLRISFSLSIISTTDVLYKMLVGTYLFLSFVGIVCSAGSWHPLHKRQDTDSAEQSRCDVLAIANELCTSGYYEESAYIAAQCNRRDTVKSASAFCQKNSGGVICGSYILSGNDIESRCDTSATAATCSAECRNSLSSTRAAYGCCVTSLNTSSQDSELSAIKAWHNNCDLN